MYITDKKIGDKKRKRLLERMFSLYDGFAQLSKYYKANYKDEPKSYLELINFSTNVLGMSEIVELYEEIIDSYHYGSEFIPPLMSKKELDEFIKRDFVCEFEIIGKTNKELMADLERLLDYAHLRRVKVETMLDRALKKAHIKHTGAKQEEWIAIKNDVAALKEFHNKYPRYEKGILEVIVSPRVVKLYSKANKLYDHLSDIKESIMELVHKNMDFDCGYEIKRKHSFKLRV